MRIGLISDTHGSQAAMRLALKSAGPMDIWLHAGDHWQDAYIISHLSGKPVITVAGNCDSLPGAKIDEFIEISGRRIWLTHGHRYGAKAGTEKLVRFGCQFEAHAVVFGHTHIPVIERHDGILLVNPGSAAYPRYGGATCGSLFIDETSGELAASLIPLMS